jgi:hypothetical protein
MIIFQDSLNRRDSKNIISTNFRGYLSFLLVLLFDVTTGTLAIIGSLKIMIM